MRAYVRINTNDQEVKFEEMPIPSHNSNEVLLKVKAFGVGIHDRYYIPSDIVFPYVIGSEGAGIIEEIGSEINGFAIGDRVIFSTSLQKEGGSWAEYAVAKQNTLIHLPDNVTFEKGATVPIAGKTALECMRELNLKSGDTLFIAGASGAIGTLVIQMAAAKGVHISASASERNHDYMKSLGAEHAVDYHDTDWIEQVKEWSNGGVTAALAIQPKTGIESLKVVKDGGLLITVSGYGDNIETERSIEVRQMGHKPETYQKLKNLVNAISKGEMKIVVEKEYSFEEALEALKKTETRRARGKSVVKVD